ncbi:MAG TPA: 30S ribosomal protein S16, partial [Polyangiaceae bacterium]|nr:30S ribosomal protein S16 [Polyangiaceae bacterium]
QRNPRDGRFIENIGTFDPSGKLELNRARFDYWKGQGAIPSETLYQLVKKLPTAPAEPGTPA